MTQQADESPQHGRRTARQASATATVPRGSAASSAPGRNAASAVALADTGSGEAGGGDDGPARSRPARRVGRPPRIDRETIARAAGEIGLDQVSMRTVAERLGVSVPGLYHYVRGRDDLLRLAAEQSAARIQVPEDRGQHWAEWLFQWGERAVRAFVAEPTLLEQFMHGVFGLDRMVDHLDTVVGLLMKQGFTPREAFDAYFMITECACGFAVTGIRARETAEAGNPGHAQYYRILAQRPSPELPALRDALAGGPPPTPSFVDHASTVLAGIAVRRGEDWQSVVERVRGTASAQTPAHQPTGDQDHA